MMGTTVAAPLEWVEAVSDLCLPPKVNDWLQYLMDRNTELRVLWRLLARLCRHGHRFFG